MKQIVKVDPNKISREYRKMLKPDWKLWSLGKTDKKLKKESPEVYKKYMGGEVVKLPTDVSNLSQKTLDECIQGRMSVRRYSESPISAKELSYLFKQSAKLHSEGPGWSKRVIPTAGATHSLETYCVVTNVEGVNPGLYRYMPNNANLELINLIDQDKFSESIYNQMKSKAVTFIWTCIPYRTEYKYTFTSHKMIAMEAGHACQNLYLASESIDFGCCAIGSYDQGLIDELMGLDGEEEFVIYIATVGKKR